MEPYLNDAVEPDLQIGTQLPGNMNEIYSQGHSLLLTAKNHLVLGEWESVAATCREFLGLLQFSHLTKAKEHSPYNHFQQIAMKMIGHHHHFDSVMTLEAIYDHMLEFTDSFFRTIMKKGVIAPKPVVTKGDAWFIYSFCSGFFSMIVLLETES